MLGRQWNWSLEWLSPDGPRVQAFRPPQIGANPKPQRVEGILEVDEFGQVTHLILNPSATFPPDRREIVLALRALRVQRGQGPLRLRFRLSLEGREVAP